jgi:integrase
VARVPIPDNPGFWRRGRMVTFKYRDQRGRQRWATAGTLREAKRKKAAIETDVARGEYRHRAAVDFTSYARGWVKTYQGRTSKPVTEQTRADYERRLEQDAIPFFQTMRIGDVEPQDVKAYAHHVATRRRQSRRKKTDDRPLAANSVRLALAPVKALFATAFEEGVIRVNPAAGVRIAVPRTVVDVDEDDAGDVRALTAGELAAVLAAVRCERCDRLKEAEVDCARCALWLLFFTTLAQLGLRIGELVELRWRDVGAGGGGTVKIRRKFYRGTVGPPKSKYGRRTLRLPDDLQRALWQHRKITRAGDGDLVFALAGGARVDPSNLMSRVLKPAARRAGVGEWVGFHTFRHTCATLLFTVAQWNPKQVQLYLGHHSAAFTVDTYIHLLPGDVPQPPPLTAAAPAIADAELEAELQAAING